MFQGIKRNAWSHTIDFKFFIQQKYTPFCESTCSLDELDEKPNHTKMSKFWNFEGKGCKAKDSFFKPFEKYIYSMGSKCLALDAIHMWRKYSCQKNVWLSA